MAELRFIEERRSAYDGGQLQPIVEVSFAF
jgi:hypothetical protein